MVLACASYQCLHCDLHQSLHCDLQALWWAWSHAQRMKGQSPEEPQHVSNEACSWDAQAYSASESDLEDLYGSARQWPRSRRTSLQAHRLSLSAQRYTSEVAARIQQSIDGLGHMPDASPERRPCCVIDEGDLQEEVADGHCRSPDDLTDSQYGSFTDQAEVFKLQQLWQHQLQHAAMRRPCKPW